MDNSIKKGLIIAGTFSAETPDRTAEIIRIKGMDISHLNSGKAILNAEHNSGAFSNYLGRILSAKKIFSEDDCVTKHETECFMNAGQVPIIYGKAELFDDEEGHTEAQHAAAIIKAYKRRGLPIAAQFSIEGASIEKNGGEIKRSVAKVCALTIRPANEACELDVMSELSKSEQLTYNNLKKSGKSENTLATGPSCDIQVIDRIQLNSALTELNSKLSSLAKALEAGMAMGGAGTATQGAALAGKMQKDTAKVTEQSENSETTKTAHEESTLIVPIDESKVELIDEKGKDLKLDLKLKKAEIFAYKVLNLLKKVD